MPRLPRLLAAAWLAGAVICRRHPAFVCGRPDRRIPVPDTTLPNGLTVVLSEDHSTPILHLQLVYHVGSKNEKPGRTGSRISSST